MIVQAPDGKNIDFGDLGSDQVKSAMGKLYPKKQEDISLLSGLGGMAKTAGKSALSLPVLMEEEFRHPIQSLETIGRGYWNAPAAEKERFQETKKSIKEDVQQAEENPDYWQKVLRGGRAGLTAMASPLDMAVGVPYENTFGKIVEKGTGGGITAREAAFLPQLAAGAKLAPESLKGVSRDTAGGLKSGLKSAAAEIKPNITKTPEVKAGELLAKKFAEGEKGGGVSLSKAIATVKQAQARGSPMVLSDVENARVKGLAGSVARVPGVGKDVARVFLKKRDEDAPSRLESTVNKYFSKNSALRTVNAVAQKRSVDSKPLYEEAYRGGSMAPLEKQFEKSFNESAKQSVEATKAVNQHLNRVTQLKGRIATTNDVYARAGLQVDLKQAEHALSTDEAKLHQAHEEKAEALEALRGSQADKSANAPGAVWNPRISRLMKNPTMRQGIAKGLRIERNRADAEGRPFNTTEYAILDNTDPENPKVGKVPNMKLLAAAKEGLDSILSDDKMRDPKTGRLTSEGVSVDMLRRSLLKELYEENPKYKEANDAWGGASRQVDMVKWGQDVFKRHWDASEEDVSKMTPSDKEFARLGAGETLRTKLFDSGFQADEAKSIIKSVGVKKRLRPLFDSDKEFNDFVDAVTDERIMFETRRELVGGSQTGERVAEDASNIQDMISGGKAVKQLFSGQFGGAVNTLHTLMRDSKFKNNPALSEAIGRLLFDPDADFSKLEALPNARK